VVIKLKTASEVKKLYSKIMEAEHKIKATNEKLKNY